VGAMLAAPLDGSQAGFDGIYLEDVSNINIANPFIFDVANHGIHIHDLEGAFTFNKITISNPTIITCGANGIHIDVATASSTLRHILINDAYVANAAGYDLSVDTSNTIVLQPVRISGVGTAEGTGLYQEVTAISDPLYSNEFYDEATGRTEIVTATNVIQPSENGKTFFLNSATEFVSTLPAPKQGLKYTFIVTAAPSGASYTVVTTGGNNLMNVYLLDIAGELVYAASQDVVTFVDGVSAVGDRLEVESDGTNWYCKAFSGADSGITTGAT